MSNRMNRRRSLAERQPRNCLKRELPKFWRLSNKTRKLGNTSCGITVLWRLSHIQGKQQASPSFQNLYAFYLTRVHPLQQSGAKKVDMLSSSNLLIRP